MGTIEQQLAEINKVADELGALVERLNNAIETALENLTKTGSQND